MRALSVRAPWAALLADGRKTIELRSWTTRYRGPLVVCASLTPGLTDEEMSACSTYGLSVSTLPRGVTVCVVNLLACLPASEEDAGRACSPTAPGEFAWVVEVVTRLDFVRIKGRLGLWTIDDSLLTVGGHPLPNDSTHEVEHGRT